MTQHISTLRRLAPWLVAALLYGLFLAWYAPWGGPLTEEEIEAFLQGRSTQDEAFAAEFRRFLENDDGGSFVMVNLIHLHSGGEQLTARYMDYMWPALLRRACHPVFAGDVIGPAVDLWGLDGAETWSSAAIMRYRSLRDLLKIAGNPAFADSHEFKIEAMVKTIAVPANSTLNPGDLRIVVALLLILLVLAWEKIALKRSVA